MPQRQWKGLFKVEEHIVFLRLLIWCTKRQRFMVEEQNLVVLFKLLVYLHVANNFYFRKELRIAQLA